MDGISANKEEPSKVVMVLAVTNFPWDIEEALTTINKKLELFSGADITSVCNEESVMSMRRKIFGLKPDQMK